jgi:hypothetical protein
MFFLIFPVLLIFERAVTLLLMKIFLNFKWYKSYVQALSIIFNTLFVSMKSSCPKNSMNASTASQFLPRLSGATENILGGGGWKILYRVPG